MKTNYTYNLMREASDYGGGGLFSEIPSYEKLYHECTEQRHQLKQQIKDQQELIEAAVKYIEESPCDPDIHQKQWEAYQDYTKKLNHFNQTYQ